MHAKKMTGDEPEARNSEMDQNPPPRSLIWRTLSYLDQRRPAVNKCRDEIADFLWSYVYKLREPRFVIEVLALIGLICYTAAARNANRLTQEQFQAIQKPYVSIGAKDGNIGGLAPTNNGKYDVELVFSNTGPVAGLRFNVSIPPAHMARLRNRRTHNQFLEGGLTSIAGNSEYRAMFPEKETQQEANAIMSGAQTLIGLFEYCDALGNYTCRQFELRYRNDSFTVETVLSCGYQYPVLRITPDHSGQRNRDDVLEYMTPCPTVDDQKSAEQEDREAIQNRPRSFKIE